jgi:8-oxo-dGTP diphosphatase
VSTRRSVAGVCLRDGRAFVAERGPSGSCAGLWEFPGGKVEPGESDEAALAREFDEEFGIAAKPLRFLGETAFVHGGSTRALAAWLIELPPFAEPELREHARTAWATPDELDCLDLVDSDRKLVAFVRDCLAGLR